MLQQGIVLLDGLSPDQFKETVAVCFGSSAGGHFRHVVEHYEGFFEGLARREIDYEARPRDLTVEQDVLVARVRMLNVIGKLEEIACHSDHPLKVRAETAPAATVAPWAESSLLRELEMLLSHTVHHYALIAITCRLIGHGPEPDFGMAPSTLRHRDSQNGAQACAR